MIADRTPGQPADSATVTLTRMMRGHWQTQALLVAAQLELPHHLHDGPRQSDELAALTATHPRSLHRLLRALAELGVLAEDDEERFTLTPLGEALPLMLSPYHGAQSYAAWGDLLHSVRTGQPAFDHVFGLSFYDYLDRRPETTPAWDAWNTETAKTWLAPLKVSYDWSQFTSVVDVGGGQGVVLATLLSAFPTLRGTLFDRPDVVVGAVERLALAGVDDRCAIVGGDIFTGLPDGADAYIVSRVLLNWDDDRAVALLATCARAMRPDSRLLIVDVVMPPRGDPGRGMLTLVDLDWLVMLGAVGRTREEWQTLLASAGFRLESVVPVEKSSFSLLDVRHAPSGAVFVGPGS